MPEKTYAQFRAVAFDRETEVDPPSWEHGVVTQSRSDRGSGAITLMPRGNSEIPVETWRRYIWRRFIERFYFAWLNRCWRCIWRPFHD